MGGIEHDPKRIKISNQKGSIQMNKRRRTILLSYGGYLLFMMIVAFIYQVAHPKDPPQPLSASAQKAVANVLIGNLTTLTGIVIIGVCIVWFVLAKDRHRHRR